MISSKHIIYKSKTVHLGRIHNAGHISKNDQMIKIILEADSILEKKLFLGELHRFNTSIILQWNMW